MGLSDVQLAFVLVIAAGSATGIGAAVVFSERLVQLASKPFLAGALGLSAGVMLYVSFVEIYVKSQLAFEASSAFGSSDAYFAATVSMFAGMGIMALLDILVHKLDPQHDAHNSSDPQQFIASPEAEAPAHASCCSIDDAIWAQINERKHASRRAKASALITDGEGAPERVDVEAASDSACEEGAAQEGLADESEKAAKDLAQAVSDGPLRHMGVMTALAIAIHNFPEGLATFVATLDDPAVGGALATAIAIHNIPEGLCVSIPIYFATGDRWKAFRWSLLSGASEPVGALVGWLLLKDHFNEVIYGAVFGMVAGMMIMICLNELIPTAHRYDPADKYVTKSILAGMMVMAASLCLFVYG